MSASAEEQTGALCKLFTGAKVKEPANASVKAGGISLSGFIDQFVLKLYLKVDWYWVI
jgi:hypothetical protein